MAELIAAKTHNIQPLRAYDTDGSVITPSNYDNKLRGATVLVAMTLLHRYIKKNKRHVFTLHDREISILRRPQIKAPSSPYKRRKLTRNIMTSWKGKEVDRSNHDGERAYTFYPQNTIHKYSVFVSISHLRLYFGISL